MSIRSLARANGTGIDTIKSAVKELEQFGYLVRSEKQKQNEDGTFADYDWITADPFQNPVTGKTRHGETGHKEEHNSIEEKELKNNERLDAHFVEFWNAYPKKLDKAKAFRAFKSAMKRAKFEDILAGVIAYRNDPQRNPEFTKYPASWLNADAWENTVTPSADSEAAERARIRREREKEASARFLAEQRAQEAQASGPKLCEHGKNLALCIPCTKALND
jgi:Sec-independent protein translocase protein TatA